jgi:hypothetical protein
MKQRRLQKRAEAELRQKTAIEHVHPDGVCNCKFDLVTGARMEENDDIVVRGARMVAGVDF